MNTLSLLRFLCVTALLASSRTTCAMTEQKDLLFPINGDALLAGGVHYAYVVAAPRTLREKLPEVLDLDGGHVIKGSRQRVAVAKLAYVVDRPVGFFSEQQLTDARWLEKLFGVAGARQQVYFDSDDLSSLRTSRFVHAVAQSKKLDPVALGSFSTVVFHDRGRVQVDNHVPLSPRKTLVISYVVARVAGSAPLGQLRREFVRSTQERLIRAYP